MTTQLELPGLPAQEQMVDNWGQPTAYMQARWQELCDKTVGAVNDLSATLVIAQQGVTDAAAAAAAASAAAATATSAAAAAGTASTQALAASTAATAASTAAGAAALVAGTAAGDALYALDYIDYLVDYLVDNVEGYFNTSLKVNARGYGTVTTTTSGGGSPGYINIAHGKGHAPDTGCYTVQMGTADPYCVNVTGADSTYITAFVWHPTTGLGVSAVSVTLNWNGWFWGSVTAFPAPPPPPVP